jgi:putative membrane protein
MIPEDTTMAEKKENDVVDTQKSVEQTASITESLFRAPKPVLLVIPILVVSLILGMLISFDMDDPVETFVINGIIILAIPTYLSGLISVPLAESLDGRMYLRRSMLMSFLCLLLVGAALLFFWVLGFFIDSGIEIQTVLIFGYSAIIWLRHLILVTTSNSKHHYSLPPSLSQPILGFIMIAIFLPPFGATEISLVVIFLIIFMLSVILFTYTVTSPMRKAFGVNGLAMIRNSLDHITEGGEEGASEVEDFFKSFSEERDVHVGLVAFKSKNKLKAIMIVPSVHPGPFGLLGGSDLPYKLNQSLIKYSNSVLVSHGTAGHGLNPSSSKEQDKIVNIVKELLNEVKYSSNSSKFIRVKDSMDVCAQVFGNGIILVHTSSPNPTDDVDHETGMKAREKASQISKKEALLVDAHNCAEKGSGCIYFGSKESDQLIDLAGKAAITASENPTDSIKAGYAQKTGFQTDKGIGKTGIQVLVIQTNSQKTAYILFDGNNMAMGLREAIKSAVSDLVNEAEVLTTDNHAVNAIIGGFNPVGLRMEKQGLIDDTKNLVKAAIDDLEDVSAGMKTGFIEGISVFGHENVTRLSSVVNSTVATLKRTTFISLLSALVASAVVFLLI